MKAIYEAIGYNPNDANEHIGELVYIDWLKETQNITSMEQITVNQNVPNHPDRRYRLNSALHGEIEVKSSRVDGSKWYKFSEGQHSETAPDERMYVLIGKSKNFISYAIVAKFDITELVKLGILHSTGLKAEIEKNVLGFRHGLSLLNGIIAYKGREYRMPYYRVYLQKDVERVISDKIQADNIQTKNLTPIRYNLSM